MRSGLWVWFGLGLLGLLLAMGSALSTQYSEVRANFSKDVNARMTLFREVVDPGDPFFVLLDRAAQAELSPEDQKELKKLFDEYKHSVFSNWAIQTPVQVTILAEGDAQLLGVETSTRKTTTFARPLDRNCCGLVLRLTFPKVNAFYFLGQMMFQTTIILLSGLALIIAGVGFWRNMRRQGRINQWQRDLFNLALHEFKTPLATMQLATRLVADSKHPPDALILEKMRAAQLRMTAWIERLRVSADRQRAGLRPQKKPLDLNQMILSVIEEFEFRLNDRTVDVQHSTDETITPISGDPLYLAQMLDQLLENASSHGGRPLRIDVSLRSEPAWWCLSVQDNGPGIDVKHRVWIFEAFYRHAHPHSLAGMGLGLFHVKKIAEMHGGTIKLLQKPSNGALFEIRLPRGETS